MKIITSALFALILASAAWSQEDPPKKDEAPLTVELRGKMKKAFEAKLAEASVELKKDENSIEAYSKRGDAHFFLGQFKEAVADYDRMLEIDSSQKPSHWRRGIALFYAERYKEAAEQFDSYHSFDQIDRENGIWRYLSQHRADGQKKAREGLLKYQKDDREPFPSVYKLFAGTMTADQIVKQIDDSQISKDEREKRLFYAQLYIGLNDAVEGDDKEAQKYLAAAVRNTWATRAGYGPNFMWHVARIHEELLREKADNQKPKSESK